MCGNTLTLGRRDIFLKGLDDVIAKPVLSMEHEFARDHKWVDWKGVEYTLRKEWAYVTGVAKQLWVVRQAHVTPTTTAKHHHPHYDQQQRRRLQQ